MTKSCRDPQLNVLIDTLAVCNTGYSNNVIFYYSNGFLSQFDLKS